MSMSRSGRERADGCSLLVRNLSRSVTLDDLRYVAEKYGRLRDVYIPKDYYSGEPRGIGFLEFTDPRDAEDAIYGLDRKVIQGKEVSVVLALQGRKRPDDYTRQSGYGGSPRRRDSPRGRRDRSRGRRSRSRERRRSPSRSVSRSPPPRRHRSVARSDSPPRDSPPKDGARSPASRSASPAGNKD
ncbi:RNA-binding domain-containing protein [Coccomyxa subellipsoidea C-169]|uniref:RNA-binding domain-containing protein n=1 Tax=Coccomyxa subellipsoidea (strain C-169) TaxID=574566 RepID=I0YS12_COCSC|nr:RNA-binding domain-containing protein [Coccomyxa subellipsoidea C-169]EIE21181.1 RNA-binding domain-containing protein [Coccomyxa subellipsoidea C-169]|eukprot:XP_005645725.1 RNA-binding domain-containing protein [Coccomyxa subellipsoidea C-169]